MDEPGLITSTLFGNWLNQLIFLAAVANTYFAYQAYKTVGELKTALFEGSSILDNLLKEKLGGKAAVEQKILDGFAHWETMYKAATKWFYLFTTLITVFPLMGIGGTVLGIIPAMADFSTISASFSLALVSTLLGVSFATLFKFVEGYLSGNYTLVSERMAVLTGDITKYLLEQRARAVGGPEEKN